jgi:hypothetical protein
LNLAPLCPNKCRYFSEKAVEGISAVLAKSPSWEAQLSRLAGNVMDTSRVALEAALNEAFAAGWRAHAAAIAELDNPPTDTACQAAEPSSVTASPPSRTDIEVVFDVVKSFKRGLTSMQVIAAVHEIDPDVSPAAVRTYLHRLKLRGEIISRAGRWFQRPIFEGNVGADSPTHLSGELEDAAMPPP